VVGGFGGLARRRDGLVVGVEPSGVGILEEREVYELASERVSWVAERLVASLWVKAVA